MLKFLQLTYDNFYIDITWHFGILSLKFVHAYVDIAVITHLLFDIPLKYVDLPQPGAACIAYAYFNNLINLLPSDYILLKDSILIICEEADILNVNIYLIWSTSNYY